MSQNKEPETTGNNSTATASDNDEVTAHSDPGTPITVGGDSATGTPITVGGEGDSATGTPITVGGDGGSSEQQ